VCESLDDTTDAHFKAKTLDTDVLQEHGPDSLKPIRSYGMSRWPFLKQKSTKPSRPAKDRNARPSALAGAEWQEEEDKNKVEGKGLVAKGGGRGAEMMAQAWAQCGNSSCRQWCKTVQCVGGVGKRREPKPIIAESKMIARDAREGNAISIPRATVRAISYCYFLLVQDRQWGQYEFFECSQVGITCKTKADKEERILQATDQVPSINALSKATKRCKRCTQSQGVQDAKCKFQCKRGGPEALQSSLCRKRLRRPVGRHPATPTPTP
jgi:hypothetical protein